MRPPLLILLLFVSRGIVRLPEQVIDARAVKAGEQDEHAGGDVVRTVFVFGITGLRHIQVCGDFFLFEVAVFSHVTDSLIFHHHHRNQYI